MNSHITAVIIGCEIAFWVIVAAGLALRYPARRPRAATVVLLTVPLVDLVLLAAVALDLRSGAEVRTVHTVAGLYLGVSVVFGPSLIRWADARFAHLFAGGPAPVKQPEHGRRAFVHECRLFGMWLLAAAVSALAVLLLSVTVADAAQSDSLHDLFPTLGVVTVIWLLTGPVWALGKEK